MTGLRMHADPAGGYAQACLCTPRPPPPQRRADSDARSGGPAHQRPWPASRGTGDHGQQAKAPATRHAKAQASASTLRSACITGVNKVFTSSRHLQTSTRPMSSGDPRSRETGPFRGTWHHLASWPLSALLSVLLGPLLLFPATPDDPPAPAVPPPSPTLGRPTSQKRPSSSPPPPFAPPAVHTAVRAWPCRLPLPAVSAHCRQTTRLKALRMPSSLQ